MRYAAALACLALAVPASPCGLSEVCTDVENSLYGQWISEGIRLDWSTDMETDAVLSYLVERSNGGSWVTVGNFAATGTCSTLKPYAALDFPGSGSWTYRVTVIDEDEQPACSATWP